MDEIKKENFDLKLRVSLLQERLARLTPENIESALAEVLNPHDYSFSPYFRMSSLRSKMRH